MARTSLPGGALAPGAARRFVRETLAAWTGRAVPGAGALTERLCDDAEVVVSELVTNAVVHAGTDVGVECRLEYAEWDTGLLPEAGLLPDAGLLPEAGLLPDAGPAAVTGTVPDAGPLREPDAGSLADAGCPENDGACIRAGADGAAGHAALVVEVSDRHPSRPVRDEGAGRGFGTPEYGRGLRLVAALTQEWGVTYRRGTKCVWARLAGEKAVGHEGATEVTEVTAVTDVADVTVVTDVAGACPVDPPPAEVSAGTAAPSAPSGSPALLASPGPRPSRPPDGPEQDWLDRGALSFLAEASDLLAGQLDEDLLAALACQLLVPRLAEWCAVWLEDGTTDRRPAGTGGTSGPRLARVWHSSEDRLEELRRVLEKDPPLVPDAVRSSPVPIPWPAEALDPHPQDVAGAGADAGPGGVALAYRLIAGGRPLGTVVIGRSGVARFPDEVTGLVEDVCRRVAQAVGAARQYARQANISRVLQRGLLPGAVAEIPGMRSALVYEPRDKGGPSGDFYDLFPAGLGRWSFAIGDVQGKGPEAAVVIGLARPWLRLLAREGYAVPEVLDRLNQLLLDDATEASDAAARALVAAGVPDLGADDGPQNRFLSLLYGELAPVEGGVRCTLASAGHPLPLVLAPDGSVRTAARPQTLLGVVEDATYDCETFELRSGDTLLCVTDGVTERRHGSRQFDDGEGLAEALAGCRGLSAELVADRIRRLVHEFGDRPPEDDLALLVLQAE
ncbi:ATP-binding SpoIIE family protein phosphatase [Streptomyces sp. NBC_00670]|uniref:ATP-binding SpoIIE family protein phosphatase n=1 Tax=Streptomyces sp. NBC_00670 TaxID=2975804 RepID=UPI002E30C4A7|nr:ATP-binding SpoIIE family protein phosphatase [Streptomyces sp. NBC_00670]